MINKLTTSIILLSLLCLASCAKDPEKDSSSTVPQNEFELLGSSYANATTCTPLYFAAGYPAAAPGGGSGSGLPFTIGPQQIVVSFDFSTNTPSGEMAECTDNGVGGYSPPADFGTGSASPFLAARTYASLKLPGVSYLEFDTYEVGTKFHLLYKKSGNNLLVFNYWFISNPDLVEYSKYFLDDDAAATSFANTPDYDGIGGNDDTFNLGPN